MILGDFFDPPIAFLESFSGEDESPLCVIPVSFTILPQHGVVTLVVICTKLLVRNLLAEDLMLFECSTPVVSYRHSVACNDFGLLLGFFLLDLLMSVPSLTTLSASWAFRYIF